MTRKKKIIESKIGIKQQTHISIFQYRSNASIKRYSAGKKTDKSINPLTNLIVTLYKNRLRIIYWLMRVCLTYSLCFHVCIGYMIHESYIRKLNTFCTNHCILGQ